MTERPPMRRHRTAIQRARRRLAAAGGVALIAAVFATAGYSQEGVLDPWEATGQEDPSPDTEYTPVAKDGCGVGWRQVAGDVFPGSAPCGNYKRGGSPTPVTVDFYAVRFFSESHGFAGGAQCRVEQPPAGQSLDQHLNECERVPVIWEYRHHDGVENPAFWRESFKGTETGFVAAIDFRDQSGERAMAVGGNGTPSEECPVELTGPTDTRTAGCGYPRREPAVTLDNTGYKPDLAGEARVWRFDSGGWSPYGGIPSEVRARGALSALDFSPRAQDCGQGAFECGLAGARGAVWMWKDGGFDTAASYRYATPATACRIARNGGAQVDDFGAALLPSGRRSLRAGRG